LSCRAVPLAVAILAVYRGSPQSGQEARVTHLAAPTPGHGFVSFYISDPCPPCDRQLATFRAGVMSRLGAGTRLSVLELGAASPAR